MMASKGRNTFADEEIPTIMSKKLLELRHFMPLYSLVNEFLSRIFHACQHLFWCDSDSGRKSSQLKAVCTVQWRAYRFCKSATQMPCDMHIAHIRIQGKHKKLGCFALARYANL
jgi:hypothetical protein